MAVKGLQRRKTVAEILTERKLLTEEQLKTADADSKKNNKTLQQSILDLNLMNKGQLLKSLSEDWQGKAVNLNQMDIDAEIANGIFEYEKYFPHGAKIELFAPQREDQPFNRYCPDGMASKVIKETTHRRASSYPSSANSFSGPRYSREMIKTTMFCPLVGTVTVLGDRTIHKGMPARGPPVMVLIRARDERMALTLFQLVVRNDQTPPTRSTPSISTFKVPKVLHLSCA